VLLFYLSPEYEFRLVGYGLNNLQRPCCGDRPIFIRMRYGLCLMILLIEFIDLYNLVIGLQAYTFYFRFALYSGY